ncbi:MAG: universal stress protein [Pseudomonadota bacterium]
MKNLRHILVAIKEPKARSQPALRKAAQLAAGCGARITLFHALSMPLYLDAYNIEGLTLKQTQKQWRDRAQAELDKLGAPLRKQGLTVAVDSDWDFPAYEAIIRHAAHVGADLIVAERHAKRHLLPSLLRFNDWELLRRSTVPVLLIKRGGLWKRPAVLAAIDPTHGLAKAAQLDGAILSAANLLAASLGGKLHVAHAWPDSRAAALTMAQLAMVESAVQPIIDKGARRAAEQVFDTEITRAGLGKAKRHFIEGEPAEVIRKLARQQRAGLVVMGAISRTGLQRLVVGNVAEQVLDSLAADVLVVKPAQFKARVGRRTRGVQLVPTPSYT